MAIGATLSTGGRGAQGDLTGVGGPGGLATKVGFSVAPLSTRPALPEPNPLGLIVGEADCCVGAGDLGLIASKVLVSRTTGSGSGVGGVTSSA